MRIQSYPKIPLTPYLPKGGFPNSMIFRCSQPIGGLGVKQMKIIEFPTFQSKVRIPTLILFLIVSTFGFSQNQGVKIALLKYSGGGDWYANPTSLPNLIQYCNNNLKTNIHPEPSTVELGTSEIFNFPFIHATSLLFMLQVTEILFFQKMKPTI